jgi:hypothetical protein
VLGDPAHGIAHAEVGDAGVAQGAGHERPPVDGEREDVQIMPPYVKTSGGSQIASTNVSSIRPSSTISRI